MHSVAAAAATSGGQRRLVNVAAVARRVPRHAATTTSPVASTSILQTRSIASSLRTRGWRPRSASIADSSLEKWSPQRSAFHTQDHGRSMSTSQRTVTSSNDAKRIGLPYAPTRVRLSPNQHRRSLHTSRRLLEESSQGRSRRIENAGATSTSQPIQKSEKSESASVSSSSSTTPDRTDNQGPKSPKDVSLGEVRRLMSLAKPEKRTLFTALGLLAVSSAVSLSVPFTLGRIIDLFTSPGTSSLPVSVPAAAAILGAVFAIGAAANTGRAILMRISGQRIVQRLRIDAYTNTMKLDMAKFDLMGQHTTDKDGKQIPLGEISALPDKQEETIVTYDTTTKPPQEQRSEAAAEVTDAKPDAKEPASKPSRLSSAFSLSSTSETTPDVGVKGVGDVISRLGSDSSIVGESLTRELSEGLRAAATVIVGVGMMVYISAKLTVVMLCIVPPTAIGAVFYGRYLKKLSRRTQKKVGEMIALAEERLSSVRTVQAFNAVEPLETKRFTKKANDILDLAKKEAYASGLFFGGAGFSGNLTLLALLTYGGKLVASGEITVGDLSSLMLYTAYVGSSLVGLTSFFSVIMKALGAAARVFELLDSRPASVNLSVGKKLPASLPPQPIRFRNVHFSYPSRPDSPILRGVNLDIERGRSIAIAGGSGSGKSTLVNLLVRYYDPSSGRIEYGQEDIKGYTPESWRERVSIVPQDPALFSQTIAENIAYGKPDATMSEIREAARLANCDFIEDLPQGFDTPVGAKAAQISGGQRQRLAIARALVRQPAILILDEATSALDAASETLVNQAVKRITSTNSLTTILIAHRLSTLKTADEIVFMEDGKVAERGTYEELAREGSRFWTMVRSQMLGTATGATTGPESESNSKEEEMAMKP